MDDQVRHDLYPEKLTVNLILCSLTVGNLSQLYEVLSTAQRNYTLIILRNDLPIQLSKTLEKALAEIVLTSTDLNNNVLLESLKTSLELLQM